MGVDTVDGEETLLMQKMRKRDQASVARHQQPALGDTRARNDVKTQVTVIAHSGVTATVQ